MHAIARAEIAKWQRIVSLETGDDDPKLSSYIDHTHMPAWRGRAQKIAVLKTKNSLLKEKINKQMDRSMVPRADYDELCSYNARLKQNIDLLQSKLANVVSGSKQTEGKLKDALNRIQSLLAKSESDKLQIQNLKKELGREMEFIPPLNHVLPVSERETYESEIKKLNQKLETYMDQVDVLKKNLNLKISKKDISLYSSIIEGNV